MFAIFFTEQMDPFYEICSSFPTVIFTVLLVFCILYWVLAVLGLVDIDILNFDVPEATVEPSVEVAESLTNLNVMSGLLLRLGLSGVPLTIVISIMSLTGWVLSFLVSYFFLPLVPGSILTFLVSIPVFFAVLYVSAKFTALLIKPMKPLFKAASQDVQKQVLGQVALVRTGRVDQKFGEATLEDGGAGLIVKVRSYHDEEFERGDRVVLLEYIDAENHYRVISEEEFSGK